jgi:hypothetical protein
MLAGACLEFIPENCSLEVQQGSVCLLAFLPGGRNTIYRVCEYLRAYKA